MNSKSSIQFFWSVNKLTTWFVSRHPGAIEWMKKQNIHIDRWETHLDPERVQTGDTVIGVLPLNIVATICEKGAKFYALTMLVKQEQRGVELDASELTEIGCKLCRYDVRSFGDKNE